GAAGAGTAGAGAQRAERADREGGGPEALRRAQGHRRVSLVRSRRGGRVGGGVVLCGVGLWGRGGGGGGGGGPGRGRRWGGGAAGCGAGGVGTVWAVARAAGPGGGGGWGVGGCCAVWCGGGAVVAPDASAGRDVDDAAPVARLLGREHGEVALEGLDGARPD